MSLIFTKKTKTLICPSVKSFVFVFLILFFISSIQLVSKPAFSQDQEDEELSEDLSDETFDEDTEESKSEDTKASSNQDIEEDESEDLSDFSDSELSDELFEESSNQVTDQNSEKIPNDPLKQKNLKDTSESESTSNSLSDSISDSNSDPKNDQTEQTLNAEESIDEEETILDGELDDELDETESEISKDLNNEINNEINDELNDDITKDVKSLAGPNVKTSRSKRIKFIKHPGQKQGLYKISSNGKYYYKVDESKQKYGLAIKGGALVLNQLQAIGGTPTFNQIYGGSAKPSVYIEYYWAYFKNKNVPRLLKKARVKLGSGLLLATGKGVFNDPNYAGITSGETLTFIAFPNSLGLHLSFDFKDKQLIVPFATAALDYLVAAELQTSNLNRTKFLGQLGAHFGGGLALSLGWLEETAKFDLDAEWGINQTYLVIELRQNVAIQTDFDFTATSINAGIQFEF